MIGKVNCQQVTKLLFINYSYKLIRIMKAYTIYPEDIGASSAYSDQWRNFIRALGYNDQDSTWEYVTIVRIETD
jgi:hypothetical protein